MRKTSLMDKLCPKITDVFHKYLLYLLITLLFCAVMQSAAVAHVKTSPLPDDCAICSNGFNDNNLIFVNLEKQQFTVTGTVINNTDGLPVTGVSILEKGTANGVISDINGKYTITVNGSEAVLLFSFVGFLSQEKVVGNQTILDIILVEDIKQLEEVVVVGYGVQNRTSVTGSISPVSSKEIRQLSVASVQSALQGQAAGVTVVNNGGPGTEPIVRVRGVGSITYGADPLYVIDGTPATSLGSFDTRDIESVEVLKDASSTAIYGSRAANGVILITTKKGKKDNTMHISIDTYGGWQVLPKKLSLLNTQQYVQYAKALNGNANLGIPSRLNDANFNQPIYTGAATTYAQTNTDWQDALFRTAMMNDNNVSISTGGEKSSFYASAGYFYQDGIMVGTGYKRTSFRFNSDHDISKRIKFGQTLSLSYGDRNNQYETQGRPNIMHMIRSVPYLPVMDPTQPGGYRASNSGVDGTDADNPVKIQKLFSSTTGTFKLFGTLFLEVKLCEILKFRTTVGVDYENILNAVHQPIYNDGFNANSVAIVRRETFSNITKMFTNQLTFEKKFTNHYLNIIAVQEQTPFIGNTMYITGNLPTNAVEELTGLTNISANGSKYQNTLLSYLGRINYDFKNKYLFSASMRADGSSKFATGKKWGYFPAASVGWRISEESFMKGMTAISEFKVRAGYGELGNNGGIGNYAWKAVIQANTDYILNNTVVNGSYFNALDNPDLKWETSKMINIGVDLSLFANKIKLSAEYFDKTTDNLILNVPYAPSIGYFAAYPANIGKMNNHGMEFQATIQINAGVLKSSLSGNLSIVRNKVKKLSTPTSTIDNAFNQDYGAYSMTRTVADQPIQSFYGWQTDGLFQSSDEVANHARQVVTHDADGNIIPAQSTWAGDIRFKDLSGPNGVPDGVIDANDRTFLGSYLPKFTYGVNYNGSVSNFDFSVFLQGVHGNKLYNGVKVITQGMLRLFNAGTEVLDAWTPTHTKTGIPRAVSGDPNQNARSSDRFIENGSYLRLKALTIGYSIPLKAHHAWSKTYLAGIRIYVSGQNLLTMTKYSGYDPEVGAYVSLSGNNTPAMAGGNPNTGGGGVSATNNGLLNNGVDFGAIPQPRTLLGGIQFNF